MSSTNLLKLIALASAPWLCVGLGLYGAANIWAAFLFYHWFLLFPLCFFYRRLWLGHIKAPRGRHLVLVIPCSVVASGAAWLVYRFWGVYVLDSVRVMDLLYRLGYDQRLLLALGLYFITVNPAFEELYWRGSVQNLMIKVLKDRPGTAILITALAFGAWHYLVLRLLLNPGYAEFACAVIVLAGYLLGLLYQRTGSLTLSLLIHSLVLDLPLIVVLFLLSG